ncbi:MAG: CoA transferase [Gammaproteobacteria bacterium]|nr:CoA transferase [Gammaproteobacteria bacterium]
MNSEHSDDLPLSGVRVVDFSTLAPGPLATLMLAGAGADVIKIERPHDGEDLRRFAPLRDGESANFALLNKGKRSVALDLKDPDARGELEELIRDADVLVEQFRPGVMRRLKLDYASVRAINPSIIYCSITGYGQSGERAQRAGHDLNYLADTGMLALSGDADGSPVIPPVLIADLAGGSYPAVINILLALHQRERTGVGSQLDISMTDNLFPLMFWALGEHIAGGAVPEHGSGWCTGGTPRYRVYATGDAGYVAVAALEQRFWTTFCEVVDMPDELRDDSQDPAATATYIEVTIAARTTEHWRDVFASADCCCNVLRSLEQVLSDRHYVERGVFAGRLKFAGTTVGALPLPIVAQFCRDEVLAAPGVGERSEP